ESAAVRPLFKAPREDASRFRAELDCSECKFNNPTSIQEMKTKTMTTLHLRKSMGRSPCRDAFLLIPLAIATLGLTLIFNPVAASADPEVFEASGATPADIQTAGDAFRDFLGPQNGGGGRAG